MPLTFSTAYDLTQLAPAVQRVTIAAIKAASTIASETNVARKTLATNVLNSPTSYGQIFTFAITSDATIVSKTAATITDADISNAIAGVWSAVAGA